MSLQPILTTQRLTLRPLSYEDAVSIQNLAGDRAVVIDGSIAGLISAKILSDWRC